MSSLAPVVKSNAFESSQYALGLMLVLFGAGVSHLFSDVKQSSSDLLGTLTVLQFSGMALGMLLVWSVQKPIHKLSEVKWLLLVAILARLLLLGVDPYTSNDVGRYLFDGKIALTGLDPYVVNHQHPLLVELRQIWQPPAEHAAYSTLYPPLSLALFALTATAGPEYAQLTWQLVLTLVSIATLFASIWVLRHANKLQHLPLVALSPILILESGLGLHVDAVTALLVMLAIGAWQRQRIGICGVLIGLGVLVKILPLMLLLPLLFVSRSVRAAVLLLLSAILTVVVGYMLTFALGFEPIGSIGVFFEKWRFASPIFSGLSLILSSDEIFLLCISLVGITAASIAYVSFQKRDEHSSLFTLLQLSVALPLIVSPVLFPWYLMALVLLLALQPNVYLILWLCLMPLTYEVLGAFNHEQLWLPADWPVVFLGMLYAMTALKLLAELWKVKPLFVAIEK
ncbi:MAG: DUF2029 domain-containing protein [Psychrobium sp.]|nr:DUF2029 domain-containing protein [Psychrobium sp.]